LVGLAATFDLTADFATADLAAADLTATDLAAADLRSAEARDVIRWGTCCSNEESGFEIRRMDASGKI
jgi:uncharacterized protein YjbI with pentapeptide repeats